MALPSLNTPEFETVIPSIKEPIKFRPFLVKEEKILYMALESQDAKETKDAILRVLETCIKTPGIEVNKLTTYDVEFLFLKLRAKSVGEIIKVQVKHPDSECEHSTEVEINLDDIEIHYNPDHVDKIDLGNDIGIKMSMPDLSTVLEIGGADLDIDSLFKLMINSIDFVYDQENVYEDFTEKEIQDFLESLTQEQFAKVQNFFETAPKLYYDVSWKCEACGQPDTVRLEGLQSFFT